MTIAQLIDRLYRTYLATPQDQPSQTTLDTTVTANETAIVLVAFTVPEEEHLLTKNTLLQIGSELVRVSSYVSNTLTATVVRAVDGTTAAAHTAGDVIILAPAYPRLTVYETLSDSIVSLGADLWDERQELVDMGTGVGIISHALAVQADNIKSVFKLSQNEWVELTSQYKWTIQHLPEQGSVRSIVGPPQSGDVYVEYRHGFIAPTDETSVLSDLGVRDEWAEILMLDVASKLVGTREFDRVTMEYVTELLQAQGVPVGTAINVGSAFIRLKEAQIRKARKILSKRTRPRIRMRKYV